MKIWSHIRLPEVDGWIQQAWVAVDESTSTVIGGGMQAAGLIVGTLTLIALLPILAHAALALLLMILGAPIWFIVALFFSH